MSQPLNRIQLLYRLISWDIAGKMWSIGGRDMAGKVWSMGGRDYTVYVGADFYDLIFMKMQSPRASAICVPYSPQAYACLSHKIEYSCHTD